MNVDFLDEAIRPLFGTWAPWILVGATLVVWIVTKVVPGWLTSRAKNLRGSPSSERYWRSRLAEALEQYEAALPEPERGEFTARVAKARTMVEAHEARRRLGMGGVVGAWVATVAFLIAAALFWGGAFSSPMAFVIAIVLTVLTFTFEFLALFTTSWVNARVLILAEAGRRGHSDLVRDDPWCVLREYDHWISIPPRDSKERKADDKAKTSWRTRFERSVLGLSAFPSVAVMDEDIWRAHTMSTLASPITTTRNSNAPAGPHVPQSPDDPGEAGPARGAATTPKGQ